MEENMFTELDILKFIDKVRNQIQADNILHQLDDPRRNPDDCSTFTDALNKVHSMGLVQGSMQGRLDLLNDMFDYFYNFKK